jgi:tetratricopeptide (TPR) repeat protein
MSTQSLQATFSAAEQAFVGGRLEEARDHLLRLEKVGHPAIHHLRGLIEHRLGNMTVAVAHYEQAARLAPNDPQIANNQGNVLRQLGRFDEALRSYDRALLLAPTMADTLLNRALLLEDMGRVQEARAGFEAMARSHPDDVRAWAGLGALEKAAGNLAAAATAYDRALAVEPENPLAVKGRARVAMERAEPEMLARYRHAIRLSPGERALLIDEAEICAAQRAPDARARLTEAVAADPHWTEGQIALARARWEWGQRDSFRDGIEAALTTDPRDAPLWTAYIALLADCHLDAAAAEVAGRARRALSDDPVLILAEATHAGRAGDLDRAEALFALAPDSTPGRTIHESVHWLRRGQYERALALAGAALEQDRWNIAYWGVIELLWRKLGDPRAEWLSGQKGLVGAFDTAWDEELAAVDALLIRLHGENVECAGQSVRDGSQTRWNLFDRLEPQLAPLHARLEALVKRYIAGLPATDDIHPLLRHRDDPMRITTSWSVRLTGAGRHVSHFHSKGLISSAFYLRVPPGDSQKHEGWLELGMPPDDFLMDLEPIASVQPQPGRLALFPSYLLHGTRRFPAGERMTVAFDVAKAE